MEQKKSMVWVMVLAALLAAGAAVAAWMVLRPAAGNTAAEAAAQRSVRVDVQVINEASFPVMLYQSARAPIQPDQIEPDGFDPALLDSSLRPFVGVVRPGERTSYTYTATSDDPTLHTMPMTLWATEPGGEGPFVHGPLAIEDGSWTLTIEDGGGEEGAEVFTATLSEEIEAEDTPAAP